MGIQLKPRDIQLINFMSNSDFVITSDIAARFFYNSKRHANMRLKQLYEAKYLKRSRQHINSDYFYWNGEKKLGMKKHRAMTTEFYLEFISRKPVSKWEWGGASMKEHGIKPDLIIWSNHTIYMIEIGNTKLMSSSEKKEIYKKILKNNEHVKLILVSEFDPKLGMGTWVKASEMEKWKE